LTVQQRHLVSIEIDNHRLSDALDLTEQKLDRKGDVGVHAEAASVIRAAVMKTTSDVDRPASLDGQPRSLAVGKKVKLPIFSSQSDRKWLQLQ